MGPTFNHLLRALSQTRRPLFNLEISLSQQDAGERRNVRGKGGGGGWGIGRVRGTEKGKKDVRERRFLLPIVPLALTVR